jgi:hypothetical protein
MGVPVPEFSLSAQRISFTQSHFPTSIFLLFCSFRTHHPWLSSSPFTHRRPFHLKAGRVLTYCFFWDRLLDDTNFSSSLLIFSPFLFSSSFFLSLLSCSQHKLELVKRIVRKECDVENCGIVFSTARNISNSL